MVEIDPSSFDEMYVIGDLHGDITALRKLLEFTGLESEEGGREIKIVFLGDYVDRGGHQIETLLTVLDLKNRFPDKLVLLRGNHEPPPWLMPYPHDFPYVVKRYYHNSSNEILYLTYRLFNKLPLVAVLENEAILLHGGPPYRSVSSNTLEEALSIGDVMFDDIDLESILWSDPGEDEIIFAESIRGAGFLYGRKTTEAFLKATNTKILIRGHEAVEGFKLNHGGKVVTVFSAPTPYGFSVAGLLKIARRDNMYVYELYKISTYTNRIVEVERFEARTE
ncbi:metallophosphoesterase family protein [Thermogladius sp. 4427co]|uniref:metallophosphoesterase family protein n=1 Tax=Thermogladius sp. 4427co TaxID=3450718 RepID=UPI003F7B0283